MSAVKAPPENAETRDKSPRNTWRIEASTIRGVVAVLALLLGWWFVTLSGAISSLLLPSPIDVIRLTWDLVWDGTLPRYTWISLRRVIYGFVLGSMIGIPIGMIAGRIHLVADFIDPVVELFRPIPALALIPLTIAWFGIGEVSKVSLIAYAVFFPVFINVETGVRQVDMIHVRAASSLGANEFQIFVRVILKSAFPSLVAGLRIGASLGFIVLVAAELIASNAGLGFMIQDARLNFQTDRILVGIAALGVLGFILNRGLLEAERRVVPWKQRI